MLAKAINLLKKNPVILLFYVGYLVLTYLIVFLLYPTDFGSFTELEYSFDMREYLIMMAKMLIAIGLLSVLSLLFMSGYGYMVAEATVTGKTSSASFGKGIKLFFVRTLLAMLLTFAIYMGFSFLMSMIFIPFAMFTSISGNLWGIAIITTLMLMVVTVVMPFIILWYPAIYVDNLGVIQALKTGLKAGVKHYWRLLLMLLVMFLPAVINTIINYKEMMEGNMFSPGYILTMLLSAIISVVVIPYLFVVYHEGRGYRLYSDHR